jgi:hypothetical protein
LRRVPSAASFSRACASSGFGDTRRRTVKPDSHGARSDTLQVAYPILSVVAMGIDIGKNSFHVVGLAPSQNRIRRARVKMRGIVIIRAYAQSQGILMTLPICARL